MRDYDHHAIEKKWQDQWEQDGVYTTEAISQEKESLYILDMFPYPSGSGLHVGHPRGYIASDVYSRTKRKQGYNVLHPMGWDAFGLPAENHAIANKTHPHIQMDKNIAHFKKQLSMMGVDYDWSHELHTTDPAFYRWTQWTFLQMFKKGLAYESHEPINWCPHCQTGLANEDVESDGTCERCGSVVEKKPLRQWVLKITEYADRLIDDLEALPRWPEWVKEAQRNWIGKSTGSEITFSLHEPEMLDINTGPGGDAYREGEDIIERNNVVVIIEHPDNDEFLCARWKQVDWQGFVTGGIEEGKTIEETALEEVREETGYLNPRVVAVHDESSHGLFWHVVKEQNRKAHYRIVHVKLENLDREEPSEEEQAIAEFVWVPRDEVAGFVKREDMRYPWRVATEQDHYGEIKVFTTRPDTLFGATYVVLAPEHPLIADLIDHVENQDEVKKYIAEITKKTELERQQSKEKTGVELKGVTAKNPANGEQIPVWIADYVLAGYGTGAVMAVPAHDDRDFEFAKKFDLPIRKVIARETGIKRENEERRDGGAAVVFDPVSQKYAVGEWSRGKPLLFAGGADEGEAVKDAILREVTEESGLYDFDHIEFVETIHTHYFNTAKKVNRIARAECYVVTLNSTDTKPVNHEDHEDFFLAWKSAEEIRDWWVQNNNEGDYEHYIRFLDESVARLIELGTDTTSDATIFTSTPVTEHGTLENSGNFSGLESEEAKAKITEYVGGEITTTYQLHDWVFSRQRYWGEPIPLVHDSEGNVHPVRESDLPVVLPDVESYEPTGTGESPLAAIDEWVNVQGYLNENGDFVASDTAPDGHTLQEFKREANTMPQWAGSSWYYIRFIDPHNNEALIDPEKEKQWLPVDLYVGGDHATRHLIYARFWHKFLYDIDVVSQIEPFPRLEFLGHILAEDGSKISKRKQNGEKPDDIIERFGADALRTYEMFIGPFEKAVPWSTDGLVGVRRFIEKLWRCVDKVAPDGEPVSSIHKTIKKVSDDIEAFKFNTAVSQMMICVNEMDKLASINQDDFEKFLGIFAPFAPHATEEIWRDVLGHETSLHLETWPTYDESRVQDDTIVMGIQVNGKVRAEIELALDEPEDAVRDRVLALPDVQKWVEGKEIVKFIYVPSKIVSIVVT